MTQDWRDRASSPEDVVSHLRNGMRVFIQGAAATPTTIVDAMVRRDSLESLELHHLHLEGPCNFAESDALARFRSNSLFTGGSLRGRVAEGRADFTPVFLSDIPRLFSSRRIPLDAALIQLSPPDRHGWCTLGTSVDATLEAVRQSAVVLAEINDQMPRTHGNSMIPFDRVTAFTTTDRPLHTRKVHPSGEVESAIGDAVAALVKDGSTLQLGIGAIPDAVAARLRDKRELGVHTEMFSDGIVDLFEAGAISNTRKRVHRGRMTTSFVLGSERLYRFVDDNPSVEFYPCDHTNDTAVIRKNDRAVAINAALEVDLSGQVVADSIGHRIYSGIGGQMDFMRGAALSHEGVAIIALPSTAAGGTLSRIVSSLKPGAGVVTTRGHVQWIVTEYGAVDLWGESLRRRAEKLISISHPDFRSALRREIAEIRHFDFGP